MRVEEVADESVFADCSGTSVLNLGCGELYEEGAINVDYYALRADVRHDLDQIPYPFPDNTFRKIRCYNVIEHLEKVIPVMEELHRIGRQGCIVTIRVPHFRSACLYEDLTHKHGFAWRSFDIFTAEGQIYGNYSNVRYRIISREYTPYKFKGLYRLLSRMPTITDNLLSKYIPMASILFVLEIDKKDKPEPD
jgi:SAM-dependent methyltransferase